MLEFTLPEEQEDLEAALQGEGLRMLVRDFDERLRVAVKHGLPEGVKTAEDAFQWARNWLRESMHDEGLTHFS
jgi:hypothetical protein